MTFTKRERWLGNVGGWSLMGAIIIVIVGFATGCTGLLIDKDTRAMLREVVASGKVTADDPEVIVEFGHSYFMRIALANTKITAKAAVKGDKPDPE